MKNATLLGAVEAGGTKFVCAVGHGPDQILDSTRIPTTTPAATLDAVVRYFESAEHTLGRLGSIGIASFGPVVTGALSPSRGRLLATPKPGWTGADLAAPLRTRFNVPVSIDTDVNAAALAEARLGAGRGADAVAYVTVGTGIGGGACVHGRTLAGLLHPEMGHIRVRRSPRDLAFAGICPFHGDCVEGLASGPAIERRWGVSLDRLDDRHEALEIVGDYLGQLAVTILYVVSPRVIVFGGGVMTDGRLLVGSSRVDLQACKLEYSIVSPK